MMQPTFVVIGAFARVEVASRESVRSQLDSIEGVRTFDLAEPEKLGLLVEAADLDTAHDTLVGPVRGVRGVRGVLGVWPVSVEADGGFGAVEGSGA